MAEAARGSIPPPSAATPSVSAPPTISESASPLVGAQELLASGRHVVLSLLAADADARAAVAVHFERVLTQRALSLGPTETSAVRRIDARRGDEGELIDAIARALGVVPDSTRIAQVAERIAERMRRGRTSLVITLAEPASSATGWASAVLREVIVALGGDGRTAPPPTLTRLILIGPPNCAVLATLGTPSVTLDATLDPREILAWIDTVARGVGRSLAGRRVALPSLEDALTRAREAIPDVSAIAEPTAAIDAQVLDDDASPWTWLRRAASALEAGALEDADRAIATAEEKSDDPEARRDIGRRWSELLEPRSPRERLDHARRATTRALTAADAEEAVRWAKIAVRSGELAHVEPGEMALLLEAQGRALVAKGDVVMARAVLDRARDRAVTGGLATPALASIAVETAEAAYLSGDLASLESEARRALMLPGVPPDVRLRARNVIGKLLLARGDWEAADVHFAADASEAARLGDRLGELRALLNRGMGLLYAERFDEAEGLLEVVLEGGRAIGEPRAVGLALENLAIIAQSHRRDYALALERYRAAIGSLKGTGQSGMLARAAHNLGYLYLRLGDMQQASTMLRLATSLFRRGLAALVAAEGDDLRARIAARMGRSEEALAAISRAREILRSAGDQSGVAECERFEARLALEDGDVRGARLVLDRARGFDDSSAGKAEFALLEAEWLRANGAEGPQILVAAREALALCRASTDEDLIVGAHLVIAEVARVVGDRELLQRHLEAAFGVRDAMMRSIPESYHAFFLARPDMIRLSKLERAVEIEPIAPVPAATSESAGARIRSTPSSTEPRKIVGSDPGLRALLAAVRRVAASDTTVLIHGESGTGKELVAEQLHFASDRQTGPLVKVNCAALVETLLLSELFGHEKGAFTGAVARRRGRFELADTGTLFLDEIGDISPRTQVALLRVLQEKTFERVGGTTPIRVDVRVVCATHRDLAAMVARGEFREDLYYRLRGVQLEVPPLRARLGDLGELCRSVLERISNEHGQGVRAMARDALELLAMHKWPGNIRELENVLRAVALLADGPEITARDLNEHVDVFRTLEPLSVRAPVPAPASGNGPTSVVIDEVPEGDEDYGALPPVEATATAIAYGQIRSGGISLFEMKRMIERDCIARALAETRGNITKAASLLGMKRPRLSQLVKHYGLSALFTEGS